MISPPRTARRLPAFLLGLALLASALWVVAHHRTAAELALSGLRDPAPLPAIALPLAVFATCLLTAAVMLLLTRRAARLSSPGFGESLALTLASAMGNLVPLQPGLVGRIAYLHRVHEIPVAVGVLLAVQATLLTLAAAVWLGMALLLVTVTGVSWLAAAMSPLLLLPAALGPSRPARAFARTLALRLAEVLLGSLRCHCCFALVGNPIDAPAALGLACAASLANTIPLLGNGLGVREWVTGLLSPALAGVATPEALTAELLNRAVEIVVVLAGGLAASPGLARRFRRALATRRVQASGTGFADAEFWSASFGFAVPRAASGEAPRESATPPQRDSGLPSPLPNTLPPPSS